MFGTEIIALAAIGFTAGFLFTAVARYVAPRVGLLDRPDAFRKSHVAPTPLVGGVAVFGAFSLTVLLAMIVGANERVQINGELGACVQLLISGGLVCLIGLYDDKWGIRGRTKLLLQILACLPFACFGHSIQSIQAFGLDLDLGPLGPVVTVCWLVGCVNVINLADGLDGLASTITMIICLTAAVHAEMHGLLGAAGLALILSGCLAGFLMHNWPPAKIFLGDAGSMSIGFLAGVISMQSSMKTPTGFAFAIPLVLVSIPVFDSLMAIIRRKLNGKSIIEPDRRHIHHCLQDRGLTTRQSLLAIAALCSGMAIVTIISVMLQNDFVALGLCGLLLLLLVIGRVFGHYEGVLFLNHLHSLSLLMLKNFGLRPAKRPQPLNSAENEEHWSELTWQVRLLGGTEIDYQVQHEPTNTTVDQLNWQNEQATDTSGFRWQLHYSVPSEDYRLSLSVRGCATERPRPKVFRNLMRVFNSFCTVTSTTISTSNDEQSGVIRLPAIVDSGSNDNHSERIRQDRVA